MMSRQIKILLSILIMSGFASCSLITKKEKELKYINNDGLLAGVTKAVCYSGFRSGQHPDKGDGAVNPTYDEVLEDLMILSEGNLFELIRLYDCGDNAEMVLRVIEENDIDIKVLLGIWLDAELSAHETCAWLNEPIPLEKLRQNKQKNLQEIGRGITLANQYPHTVVAVNVGNEALVEWNDHKVSPDTVIAYVKMVKERINQPVTVADNYKWWAEHDNVTFRQSPTHFIDIFNCKR